MQNFVIRRISTRYLILIALDFLYNEFIENENVKAER